MPKYPARKPAGKKSGVKNKQTKLHVTRASRKTLNKIAAYILMTLVSISVIGSMVGYKYLTSSYASALSSSQISLISEFSPSFIYVVVDNFAGEDTKLLKFEYIILNDEDKKTLIYTIPIDTVIDMPGKIGEERLSKVFTVAGLNSGDAVEQGRLLLSRAAFKIFGYKVDKFILADRSIDTYMGPAIQSGNAASLLPLLTKPDLNDHLSTDISLKEFYKMLSFIKSLPSDRLMTSVIDYNGAATDTTSIDEELKDISYDSPIAKEESNIAVLNATDTAGFANFGSRIITNNGGRVVAISNALETREKSVIISDNPNSPTVLLMQRVFNIEDVISKEKAHETFQEAEINRTDITVVLGFDTRDLLY